MARPALLSLIVALGACAEESRRAGPTTASQSSAATAAPEPLPADLERGFAEPGRLVLRAVDARDGDGVVADLYVLPELEDPDLFDAVALRLGHARHSWYSDEGEPSSLSSVRTDADGRLAVEVPSGLGLRVQVLSGAGEDLADAEVPVAALTPGEVREVELALEDALDLEFFGRLEDARGAPVAGAEVVLYENGVEIETARADAEGGFALRAHGWRSPEALVAAEGFGPGLVTVVEGYGGAAGACPIVLAREARLELCGLPEVARGPLTVRADLPAQPWAIELHFGPIGMRAWIRDLEPDADGCWRADGLPSGIPIEFERGDAELGSLELAAGANVLSWNAEERTLERSDG